MRIVITLLLGLVIVLQVTLWTGRGGVRDVRRLQRAVAEQQTQIANLKERNRTLAAEVVDLKQGLVAIEELARSEMGMIKKGEQFFRIIDQPSQVVSSESDEAEHER